MRFQVPQFVDIEDKVIGPFTIRQFMYYFAGVLVLIPIFLLSDLSLFITLAIPIIGLAALFAHFKLNGMTLVQVIMNAVGFYTRPQMWMWRRVSGAKPLRVSGEDIVMEMVQVGADAELSPSLQDRASRLEAEGKIVNEDEQDPLGDVG